MLRCPVRNKYNVRGDAGAARPRVSVQSKLQLKGP